MRTRTRSDAVLHAAARGALAAMAMTGLRRLTTGLGLVEDTPPEEIAHETPVGSLLLSRIPAERHGAAIELAHWTYGVVGGAVFGALWGARAPRRWTGPAYGLALWTFFETAVVPLLGITRTHDSRPVARALVAADHVLYGLVVSGQTSRAEGR